MKRYWIIAACFAGGFALNAGLRAQDVGSPGDLYSSIAQRNVFGLVPVVTTSQSQDIKDLPVIVPNGIVTLDVPQVLCKILDNGRASQPHEYIAREGQEIDGIKVVKIDVNSEAVTFDNHGIVQRIPLPFVANRVDFQSNEIH